MHGSPETQKRIEMARDSMLASEFVRSKPLIKMDLSMETIDTAFSPSPKDATHIKKRKSVSRKRFWFKYMLPPNLIKDIITLLSKPCFRLLWSLLSSPRSPPLALKHHPLSLTRWLNPQRMSSRSTAIGSRMALNHWKIWCWTTLTTEIDTSVGSAHTPQC